MRAKLLSTAMLACVLACSRTGEKAPDTAADAGDIDDGGSVMDAGDDAGADGSVIDAGRPFEPPPVEIDRTGLIPTSGKQLLLVKALNADVGGTPVDVFALDLESEELHELDSNARIDHFFSSPDFRTLIYSKRFPPSGSEPRDLAMVRMLDDGVVPMRRVSDVVERTGLYSSLTWIGDGRFAVLSRPSEAIGDDLDVIDVHAGTLYAAIDDGDGVTGEFFATSAPNGLSFFYGSGRDNDEPRLGFARITAEGIETIESPGPSAYPIAFSHDGTRAIFRAYTPESGYRHWYRDLPAGELIPIDPLIGSNAALGEHFLFSDDRDRVITSIDEVPVRLSLATGESIPLTEPGYELVGFIESKDHRVAFAVVSKDFNEMSLVDPTVVDATGVSPAMLLDYSDEVVPGGAVGAHHVVYRENTGLVVVGRDDAGALRSVKIAGDGGGSGCFSFFGPGVVDSTPPDNRSCFMTEDGFGMIDLDEPSAAVTGMVALQHGSPNCPIWNADGTAFVYTEHVLVETGVDGDGNGADDIEAESWVYVVRWPKGDSPSEPELVFHDEGFVEVVLAQP